MVLFFMMDPKIEWRNRPFLRISVKRRGRYFLQANGDGGYPLPAERVSEATDRVTGSRCGWKRSYDPFVLAKGDQLLVLGEVECVFHDLKPFFNTA